MGLGLFFASLLWGGAQVVHNQSEQRKREEYCRQHIGLGENIELEKELALKYYQEMEQCYRDELQKILNNEEEVFFTTREKAYNKMLEKHFPRALNNPVYTGCRYVDINWVAVAKARLAVWNMGYKISNTTSRAYPPTDNNLLMSGHFPFFTRKSGAWPIKNIYSDNINGWLYKDKDTENKSG